MRSIRALMSVEARVSRMLTEYGADSPEYRAERFMWRHPAQRLPRELQRELDASATARGPRRRSR
jgi:hypothetical protein